MPSIVLTDDEIALIHGTIVEIDLDGVIAGLIERAKPVRGGRRLQGSDDEFETLLNAVWAEIRGYHRLDEERAGRELQEPVPGSTAARLTTIYDRIEQHLS